MKLSGYHDGMRYFSLNQYLKETFGCKVYKLALNGGMSCPNRDGENGTRGCIFCSSGGSGEFAAPAAQTIGQQIETAKAMLLRKVKDQIQYIAYFQAYTNTYAPVETLRTLFTEAISHPEVAVLSIATRPDCLPDPVIALLQELNQIKPVWIELGLQTIHQPTADYIRRGYTLSCYESALQALQAAGIKVIVHMIFGLPFETRHMMLETIKYISNCGVDGIKLQLLHVLRGTDLEQEYQKGVFTTLEESDYIRLVADALELLPPEMVIHRLTGDGPRKLLVAPLWSIDKRPVLQHIQQYLAEQNTWQGRLYPS